MDIHLTKLSSKGQIVIPKEIREALNLEPGRTLIVSEFGTLIMLKPVSLPDEDDLEDEVNEMLKEMDDDPNVKGTESDKPLPSDEEIVEMIKRDRAKDDGK